MDEHFAEAPLEKNVPALMALIGVWNTNFLGAPTHAVLPYSNALRLLPAYLQQLEMESNGKRVDRAGRAVDYATAPVLWGARGHGEPALVPPAAAPGHAGRAGRLHRHRPGEEPVAPTAGRRPTRSPSAPTTRPCRRTSSTRATGPRAIFSLEELTARNLGRLIALYEHKVFTQGVIWNINSFDQWGVELGKELAKKILTGER